MDEWTDEWIFLAPALSRTWTSRLLGDSGVSVQGVSNMTSVSGEGRGWERRVVFWCFIWTGSRESQGVLGGIHPGCTWLQVMWCLLFHLPPTYPVQEWRGLAAKFVGPFSWQKPSWAKEEWSGEWAFWESDSEALSGFLLSCWELGCVLGHQHHEP